MDLGGRVRRWARRSDPYVVTASVLVLLPPLAAAVSALRHPWVPSSDWAHIEIEVRAVGTADTPLVGATSRFQWNHPGPLPFYAMALFYRLVPSDHGLLFAAAAINILAVAGIALVVRRWPRARALLTLLGLAIVERGLGIADLSDPWNPTLPLIPFVLYVVLALEVATSERRWPLAALVGVGAFVIEAHLAFTHPVLLIGGMAFALRVWRIRRAHYDEAGGWRRLVRDRWKTLAIASAVGWLCWTPPLLDQLFGDGNLGKLVRFSLGEDTSPGYDLSRDAEMPWGFVPQYASWLLEPTGLWMGRATPHISFGSPLLVGGGRLSLLWIPLALGVAYLLARFGRVADEDRSAVNAAILLAAMGVVATFTALPGLRGTPVYWPFRWVGIAVMAVWLALAWSVAAFVSRHIRNLHRYQRPALITVQISLVALIAYPVALAVWRGSLGDQPFGESSDSLLALRSAIERIGEQDEPVTVYSSSYYTPEGLAVPVLLERAGIRWVDGNDPEAGEHPRFEVLREDALSGAGVAEALRVGNAEVAARAASSDGNDLILLRWRPSEDHVDSSTR